MDPARARGFDAWAGDYDRFRPTYPEELFQDIAQRLPLPRQPHVVDLGAGTGRASLAMAELGWRVTAVEPGKPMLDVLHGRAANQGLLVSSVQATAEETGLDAESADLVTAAQSFHWFDKDRALREAARILKPSGGLALFWNVRDAERSPFLADYGELLRHITDDDAGRYEAGLAAATGLPDETRRAIEAHAAAFESPQLTQLRHEVTMTGDEFVGMAFTASYVRVGKSPEEQDRFRLDLAALLGRHGLSDGRPFPVPYRLDLWTARRKDR
ncbi:MAG TPA: methyltransferase domain-containing protein [Candidatus Limnocylindria bacterium]|nr:methyltransferase domain-containing protein [Candidatus Limnocylindria bacterium]